MVKVKKAIIKEGLVVGYEIIEVTQFLVDQELSKPKENRSTLWKHVSVATPEEVNQYSTEAQKKAPVPELSNNNISEEFVRQLSEIKEMNEMVLSENEELKQQIKALQDAKAPALETKKEVK